MITNEDRKILLGKDHKLLAKWWCILNSWEWPNEIPNEEASKFNDNDRRTALMEWIFMEVGHKLTSRVWNKDSMTDDEHEDFYKGTFENDKEAKKRYEKRRDERIKEANER